MIEKQTYKGIVTTKFRWLIPLILGVSNNELEDKSKIYAIHITPFFEFCFGLKGTRGGYEKIK